MIMNYQISKQKNRQVDKKIFNLSNPDLRGPGGCRISKKLSHEIKQNIWFMAMLLMILDLFENGLEFFAKFCREN